MAISKVIYGDQILIDLTSDTVSEASLLTGVTAHGANGELITGSCGYDVNSQDATAQTSEILSGKTAYARGSMLTGTMPNRGGVNGSIAAKSEEYTIPQGYHDGSGKVGISASEQAKIIPTNIRSGIQILGVTGTMESSSNVTAQAKSVTPSTQQQVILPDSGYDYLSQVTVNAISYVESQNSAGGTTVTIAG